MCGRIEVSVPIRGLFNLTNRNVVNVWLKNATLVSVPIRGLFNLTLDCENDNILNYMFGFRPHQGII